jgi:ABC-type nitrate/sulfonate/bicarbonate transport system permease component
MFPYDALSATLMVMFHADSARAVFFLVIVWILAAPVGITGGIVLGQVICRISRLTIEKLNLLRIAQWVPLLMPWSLANGLSYKSALPLSISWLVTYCAVGTGLATAHEYLLVRYISGADWKPALEKIIRRGLMRALFISLILDITVAGAFWPPWRGKGAGYVPFVVLAGIVLLINRCFTFSHTFSSNTVSRMPLLLAAFERESVKSLLRPSLLIVVCAIVWLVAGPFLMGASPVVAVFSSVSTFLAAGYFYRDIVVSVSEVAAGMVLSGSLAAAIVFLRSRSSDFCRLSDPLLQICQLAPIAALPQLQYLFLVVSSPWSILCVAIFTLYPFLYGLTGLKHEGAVRRLALAASGALPYGCAAVVLGEMWSSTAGIAFEMTVAAATFQYDKAMVGLIVLIILFATLTIALHWIAKNVSPAPKCDAARVAS